MSKRKLVMIMIALIMLVALGGCAPSIKTNVDFTKSDYADKVDVEADDSAMPSGSAAGTSSAEPADYVWAHEHGLVLRKGRVFTKDAYMGDFKAELVVDIQYAPPAAEGFVLGIGFKELPTITYPWPNLFKAVQFYGNHTGLPEAIAAYTVLPHMPYTSLVSLLDTESPDVLPFVDELLPGLVIGDGVVSGTNTIVLERKGGTISITVNGTVVGTYESEYILEGYSIPPFINFYVEKPIRIGVFSACVHAEGDYDEGVFLRSLKVYADELVEP